MSDSSKTQLGKILLKQKLVKPVELETLLSEQQEDHTRLASKALAKGYVDEVRLLKALSEQHGVPATNLDEVEIEVRILDLVPRDIAIKHVILPVTMTQDRIHLAMANPDDRRVIDELEFVSGKRVFPHVALHTQLTSAIEACYAAKAAGKQVFRGNRFGMRPSVPTQGILPPPPPDEPGTVGTVVADGAEEFEDLDIEVEMALENKDENPRFSEPPTVVGQLPTPIQPVANVPTYKVLVVDDEDDIRLLISRVLTDKGYNVVTASRGLEAIAKVQSENPDMIILDAMLPEIHGFDICKKIKGSSKYGHIPVIMISAIYRGWRYAKDLKDSYGVDEFIEKPFKIGDLLETVERRSRESVTEAKPRHEELSKEAERTLAAAIEAYRGGKLDAAIEMLKKGIAIDPLAARVHYHLALLLGKKGLSYQAIRSLESALELAPDYFPALKNLAVLYQKTGFKLKAIETWERALGHCTDEKMREGIKRHLVSLL